MNPIPCLDLKRQHAEVKAEIWSAFEEVYKNTAFSGGPFVQKFEDKFAAFCETDYAVGVNSGTSALHLALIALDIKAGDEVILPANTFIATAWAVSYVGAKIVFADCDPHTWEIDPIDVEKKITAKTKLIIGVHLYGQPFDVDKIKAIAEPKRIMVMEDSAQAHGARYKGKRAGSLTEIACFSFYPGKNLGTTGEGGGITTSNQKLVEHLHSLRNHGSKERYYHDEIGFNMRMGGLEGAALDVKMKYIENWNEQRKLIAKRYQTEIVNQKIKMQLQPDFADSVYHLFVVTVENREHFIGYLNENQISPALHYPVPCHLQKAYLSLGYKKGDFPNAEYLADHCVSLPMFAELTEDEVSHVIKVVNAY